MDYLPKTVYKYMEPKYLKQLQKNKEIYINHLNNYPEERLGSEIGDNTEGTLKYSFKIDDYTFKQDSSNNPSFENAFRNMQSAFDIKNVEEFTMKNVSIEHNIDDKNYYVYCSCLGLDADIRDTFGGSMLIIDDFPKFLVALNNSLIKEGIQPFTFGNCKYVSKRENVFTELDTSFILDTPFLIKENRYAYQKEFRVLWRRLDGKEILSPLSIKCPEALKYCTFKF